MVTQLGLANSEPLLNSSSFNHSPQRSALQVQWIEPWSDAFCKCSIGTQILCSFTTLPLFALVSQMSTIPKKAFLPKHIDKSMRKWHNDAKLRLKVKVIENYKRKRGMGKSLITPLDLQMVNSQFLNDRSATPINTPIVLSMEEGPSYPSR